MTAATTKLPVWRTARETYALIFGNFGFLIRVGWPWMLLAVALLLAMDWGLSHVGARSDGSRPAWRDIVDYLASSVVQVCCLATFAVHWHRHVLRTAGDNDAPALRLILAYAFAAFAIELIFSNLVISPLLLISPNAVDTGMNFALIIAFAVLFPVGAYLWCRLTLVLPAIALGRDSSVGAAWFATRDNGMRLLLSSLLAFMLPFLLWLAINLAKWAAELLVAQGSTGAQPTTAPQAAAPATWDLLNAVESITLSVLLALLAISFLSVAYRELVLKRADAISASRTASS